MAGQPVPNVTDDDVQRVTLRDFGGSHSATALSILQDLGRHQENWRPSPRVCLAVLKLADGNVGELRHYTKIAIEDYRDVIALAEYPRYFREVCNANVAEPVPYTIIDDDWNQYREWLEK
jgi:hypothetical protein